MVLLQQCHWVVDKLYLLGNVDEHFWEGLTSAMPIGLILHNSDDVMLKYVRVSGKVLARGGPDQLRRVWRFKGGFGAYW